MSGPHRRLPRWAIARRLTALAFLALLLAGRLGRTEWAAGSTTGTTVAGAVPLTDPLAFLEATLASGQWMPRAALGAALLVGAALLLGPVFCGWVCPLGLVLDLAQSLRSRRHRLSRKAQRGLPPVLRYGVLAAVLAFAVASGLPAFGVLSPIHLVGRSVALGLDPWLWVVAGWVVLELFVPRVWCRALCPLGALYSLVGRRAPLRVRVNSEHECRVGCGLCSVSCPMGIPVMSQYAAAGADSVLDPACSRCGACIDSCPKGLLVLSARKLRARRASSLGPAAPSGER